MNCELILLIAFVVLFVNEAAAAGTSMAPAASPTPAPLNLTGILDKGGVYTSFLRLLDDTRVGAQLEHQLEDKTTQGLTILAPTDAAFSSLKPGTLNKLSTQQESEMILYHVLPKYYSLVTFQMTSNPVNTLASSDDGVDTVNVTSTTSLVNVSTGFTESTLGSALYSEFPLAVYPVDRVFIPPAILAPKPKKPSVSPATVTSTGGSSPGADSTSSASRSRNAWVWSFLCAIVLLRTAVTNVF